MENKKCVLGKAIVGLELLCSAARNQAETDWEVTTRFPLSLTGPRQALVTPSQAGGSHTPPRPFKEQAHGSLETVGFSLWGETAPCWWSRRPEPLSIRSLGN